MCVNHQLLLGLGAQVRCYGHFTLMMQLYDDPAAWKFNQCLAFRKNRLPYFLLITNEYF